MSIQNRRKPPISRQRVGVRKKSVVWSMLIFLVVVLCSGLGVVGLANLGTIQSFLGNISDRQKYDSNEQNIATEDHKSSSSAIKSSVSEQETVSRDGTYEESLVGTLSAAPKTAKEGTLGILTTRMRHQSGTRKGPTITKHYYLTGEGVIANKISEYVEKSVRFSKSAGAVAPLDFFVSGSGSRERFQVSSISESGANPTN